MTSRTRSRECQAEEVSSGADARQRDVAGCELKKVVTPDTKLKAVAHLVEVHQVSQRRACSALDVVRSTVRYQSRRSDDTSLRNAMKAVTTERRQFGYARPGRALRMQCLIAGRQQVMVQRQGWHVNHKKFHADLPRGETLGAP